MRAWPPFVALLALTALTACGGGGGGTSNLPGASGSVSAPAPTSSSGAAETSQNLVTPTFTITIPLSANGTNRQPAFVSAGALSVAIALTSDSAGITPSSLSPNPAVTNVNGSSGLNCNSGCTVSGPPSPPGTDAFTVTVYTLTGGGGQALDTNSTSVTISEGVNNAETLMLQGITSTLTLTALPTTWAAGAANSTAIGLTARDALGNVITGSYANAVTVTDNDTNSDGTHVAANCSGFTAQTPSTSGNPTTSVAFTSSTSANTFCYLGLALAQVTLTATASGATSGTATFTPISNLPTAGTTTGAFVGTDAQLAATTGTGSTGTIAYTETGFTNAPYDQVLSVDTGSGSFACSIAGPLSTFATVSPSVSAGTTLFTVTAASPNTPGKCTIPVWDGLGGYTPPTFTASYTTSGFTVDGRSRRH